MADSRLQVAAASARLGAASTSDSAAGSGPESTESQADVMAMLESHRIPVLADGDRLVLLGGAVEILPPYTANACRSSNTVVLSRIRALLGQPR